MKIVKFCLAFVPLAGLLVSQIGCAVPQPRGKGLCQRLVEPATNSGYWLYLPEKLDDNNGQRPDNQRWPAVITFHGLKPYDNAKPQVYEWQQEADRYGFIVIAPELRTCDSLTMQYPLRDHTLPYVQRDMRSVLAIMDEVFRRTNADPSHVLATSFSSGGYIAHFLVNRFPERFSCLAVRGSNFGEELLDQRQVHKYRDTLIGIFWGENDFKDCREQSMSAVEWYRKRGFQVVAKIVGGLGHQRRPQTAATLFASTMGITPKTPPDLGEKMVMMDVPVRNIRSIPRRSASRRVSTGSPAQPTRTVPHKTDVRPAEKNIVFNKPAYGQPASTRQNPTHVAPTGSVRRLPTPARVAPRQSPTPKRPTYQRHTPSGSIAPRSEKRSRTPTIPKRERATSNPPQARIRVHGETVGHVPMWVSMSAEMPLKLREGASILWTDNNKPIGTSVFDVQSILREPGEHKIEARIITDDDQKITLTKTIKVLAIATSQPANS